MNVLVYDPDSSRLQQTARTLGGYQVTAVQDAKDILGVESYHLMILHQDIDPKWVGALIQKYPSIIVMIGMERKPIDAIREWTRIGARECLKYPVQMDRIAALLGPSFTSHPPAAERVEANVSTANQEVAATVEQTQEEPQPVAQQPERKSVVSSLPWEDKQTTKTQQSLSAPVEENRTQVDESSKSKKGKSNPFSRKNRPKGTPKEQLEDQIELEITDDDLYDDSFVPTRQETIAVTSARGGVGKSTIVYNLATLAANSGIRTVVVDIDPRGNLAQISNTKYRYNADQWDKIDPDNDGEKTVKDLLAPMQCGAFLLPSGRRVNGMPSETFEKVMTLLRRYFQLIIIDCEPRFTPTTLKSYQLATSILMVTPGDVTTFGRTIEKINQMTEELDVDPQKIRLVVNRIEDFDKDAEEILVRKAGCKVVAKIPTASDLRKLQKQGKPAVSNSKSGFTKELKKLLSRVIFVPEGSGRGNGSGWFSKLFKKSS